MIPNDTAIVLCFFLQHSHDSFNITPNLPLTVRQLNAVLDFLAVLCVLRIHPTRDEQSKYYILKLFEVTIFSV